MSKIESILNYLDGKKSYILGVVMVTVPYLIAVGAMDQETGNWIMAVLGVFGITAKAGTNYLGNKK